MFAAIDARLAFGGELRSLIKKGPFKAFMVGSLDRFCMLFCFVAPQLGSVEAVPQNTIILENLFINVQHS